MRRACNCARGRLSSVSLALTVSNRRHDCCLSSFSVSDSTLHDCKYSLRAAFQCIAQPKTTLLECILYLMQHLYDPGILPSCANQCILGKVYLRSNFSRREVVLHKLLLQDLQEEEEEDYKLWPANKSDRSWQSLSNPAKRHSFMSNKMLVTSR